MSKLQVKKVLVVALLWIQIAKELAEIKNLNFTQIRGVAVSIFNIIVSKDGLYRWSSAIMQEGLCLSKAEKRRCVEPTEDLILALFPRAYIVA